MSQRSAARPSSLSTRDLLIEAAYAAFSEDGYERTNSNLIARAAGFSPQTFYRHFADKLEIFTSCYERWVDEELAALALSDQPEVIAAELIRHHTKHRVFRRSLRNLAVIEPSIADARANSRLRQLELMSRGNVIRDDLSKVQQVTLLLSLERLCDAIADNEAEVLGISNAGLGAEIANILKQAMDLR